eukprot:COSAG03_NODE_10027_length_677_cov_1.453287_2_plen_113_part_00
MRGLTEACSRPVVANIVLELRRHGLRLEVAAHLLLEVADLVENVALDLRPFRVVAVARVAALAERNWDRFPDAPNGAHQREEEWWRKHLYQHLLRRLAEECAPIGRHDWHAC